MVSRSYVSIDDIRSLNGVKGLGQETKIIVTLWNLGTDEKIEAEETKAWEYAYNKGGEWREIARRTEEVAAPVTTQPKQPSWWEKLLMQYGESVITQPGVPTTPVAPAPVKAGMSPGTVNMLILGGVGLSVLALAYMFTRKK